MLQSLSRLRHDVQDALFPPAPKLRVLTVFVTNVCNAKCAHCFYWTNLNTPTDMLSQEEYAKIAANTPDLGHLVFSGGEPTLAKNLVEVAELFITKPHQTIDMPTNGIKTDNILALVRRLVSRFPQNTITVGVSMDGLEETHDRVRGVPGNFKRCLKTIAGLTELRKEFPNLRVTTLSCIIRENAEELTRLLRFIDETTDVDYVTVEPLREQKMDQTLLAPTVDQVRMVHDLAMEINFARLKRMRPHEATIILSSLEELYSVQQNFFGTGELAVRCQAGSVSAVLEPNGDVRCCELRGITESVRNYDFSIPKLLATAKAEQERVEILAGKCACTHCINIGQSIRFERKTALERVWRQKYMAWRMFHSPAA
ncbi:MAG: radical SAM protein [Candidatus Sumerlaeia bacterium]|nr:radical SAM protein [Candidatus Sumerlaeia bacterium]